MRKRTRRIIIAGPRLAPEYGLRLCRRFDPQEFTQIQRGRYLAILSDCASCHTVPGSGHPFAGGRPSKLLLATSSHRISRLTWRPVSAPGAMTRSTRRSGRHTAQRLAALSGDAVQRLHENVPRRRACDPRLSNTVTPVRNAVVADTLPFPFNIRASMRVWDALYFKEGDYDLTPSIRRMESRRVPGRWPGSLRRLPYAENVSRRRQDQSISAGRLCRVGRRRTSQTMLALDWAGGRQRTWLPT